MFTDVDSALVSSSICRYTVERSERQKNHCKRDVRSPYLNLLHISKIAKHLYCKALAMSRSLTGSKKLHNLELQFHCSLACFGSTKSSRITSTWEHSAKTVILVLIGQLNGVKRYLMPAERPRIWPHGLSDQSSSGIYIEPPARVKNALFHEVATALWPFCLPFTTRGRASTVVILTLNSCVSLWTWSHVVEPVSNKPDGGTVITINLIF